MGMMRCAEYDYLTRSAAMRLRRAATAIAGSELTARAPAEDSRLRGRWLLAARAAWLSVAALSLALFIAGIPAQVAFAQAVCPTAACRSGQRGPAGILARHAAGLTLDFYVAYVVALNVAFTTVFALVGALIFWRRSDDRMALLASIALLTFGISAFTGALDPLALEHPTWRLLVAAVSFLG